jgi:hypothetical protein
MCMCTYICFCVKNVHACTHEGNVSACIVCACVCACACICVCSRTCTWCTRASGGVCVGGEPQPGGACTDGVCESETERVRIKRSVRRAIGSELVCGCACLCACVRERERGGGWGKREGLDQFFFHLAAIRPAGVLQKQIYSENQGGIQDMQPPHACTFTETQP